MIKLDGYGAGPKIGLMTMPYLIFSVAMTLCYPKIFTFPVWAKPATLFVGVLLLLVGFGLYFYTSRQLLKGKRENRLVVEGCYKWSRNPLYLCITALLMPGFALLMNSWLVLLTSIVGYVAFRRLIHSENEELESDFGEAYRSYYNRTPALFPWDRIKR